MYTQSKMRAGLKTVHKKINEEQSVYRTIMNALLLKDIIKHRRRPVTIIHGYRFDNQIGLFSAIIIADLKQNGDKESLKKFDNIQRQPSSLLNLVSKTFRPIVGNTVHLSNDLGAVQQWCDLHKKNVIIRRFDVDTRTLINEFDSKTCFESIEMLKTHENNDDYYHVLLDTQGFLKNRHDYIKVDDEPVYFMSTFCK